jgi:hypothetical protein
MLLAILVFYSIPFAPAQIVQESLEAKNGEYCTITLQG